MGASSRRRAARVLVCVSALAGSWCASAPALGAGPAAPEWEACGVAADVQCATVAAPLDYDRPEGETLDLHVARVSASDEEHRIGTLFLNFGGPGAQIAEYIEVFGRELFPALSGRFDLVGVDARGTGATEGAIDCRVDQETTGLYSQPFFTPLNLDQPALLTRARTYVTACLENNDRDLLAHFSTANTARDMDWVRQGLGERRLNYLGFSYGTVLGATYAKLFPRNFNRLVLDGPVDATGYLRQPAQNLREQTAGLERALARFFQACAADQDACSGFGGQDPWKAYDRLIDRADASPIPAPGAPGARPVDGDDIINATTSELYSRSRWGELAYALARAEAGDASAIRELSDATYGLEDDGTYDPGLDRYFVLGAVEQRFSRNLGRALREGDEAWGEFDHFYNNFGYIAVNYALWPIRDPDAFYGPFRLPEDAATPLVTATTYDPATPFNGARRLARDLGGVRFLEVRADGHTVYGQSGPCGDAAIEAYLLQGTLPAPGTVCEGEQPFERFEPGPASRRAAEERVAPSQLPLQRPER